MPEPGPRLTPDDADQGRTPWPGWACYLACSWTWCIGLFLPVLLIRDFGAWSFAVFAIPNMIGAAAMGLALRPAGASEAFVRRHGAACEAFSLITRAFQFFFLIWLVAGLQVRAAGFVALAAFIGGTLLGTRPLSGERRLVAGAAAIFVVSAGLLIASGVLGGMGVPAPARPTRPEADLLWLAPVVIFGFLLCPWLDLTFHHARQSAPGAAGDAAFIVGFGVLFAAIIAGTFFYAVNFLDPAGVFASPSLRTGAGLAILAHIGGQLGYTAELHRQPPRGPRSRVPGAGGFTALFVGLGAGVLSIYLPAVGGLSAGEALYRLFMAFYGLVFPAYIWLCAMPARGGAGPSARSMAVWAGAVAVAAPMFWMGFIARETWWLGPGLGVVLLARVAVVVGRGAARA